MTTGIMHPWARWHDNMKQTFLVTKLLILACSLTLAACGGGGGSPATTPPTPPTPTTITGKAEAPGGVIAQFETGKPILLATIDFILPSVRAGIAGLQPVGGATVELIRIDNDGNQVGTVLASAITSITGNYSLDLPTGVSLAGDLVVRISGTTASMSAMVVDETVNINPISQFLLTKFVDYPALILADLPVDQLVELNGRVAEFDLTATADLSTMLAQLEAEVGGFVDVGVAVIAATPDDGTASAAAAGNWHSSLVGLGVGVFGSVDPAAALIAGINSETGTTVTDAGNGNLTISSGTTVIDASADYVTLPDGNRTFEYRIVLNTAADSSLFPAVIDADSNISIPIPIVEDLDPGDDPEFGWRFPPNLLLRAGTTTGNTYVANNNFAAVGYGTVDTNNDGLRDAINPADRRATLALTQLQLFLRQGTNLTGASLDGDYGTISLRSHFSSTPQGIFESTVGVMNLTVGTATIQANTRETQQVIRTPVTLTDVTLTNNGLLEPGAVFPYTVSATGRVVLDFAGDSSDVLEGFTNADGSVIVFVESEAIGAPTITDVSSGMHVSVKLGTEMESSLNGAGYKLYRLVHGMRTNGYSETTTLGNGTAVFDASATTASINGTVRGFSQSTDTSPIDPLTSVDPAAVYTVDSIAANGAIAMSLSDGTTTDALEGFISADSNLLVMRIVGSDTGGGRDIGMLIGVKQ